MARALLGRTLVSQVGGVRVAGRIVEVEAYRGGRDPASHAHRGPTPRNRVMFGPPGRAYVYFTYGMHHCLNLVCEPRGRAAAVLIRALEPLSGVAAAARRRGAVAGPRLMSGPGCVAQALGLTREQDGSDLLAGPLGVLRERRQLGSRRICSGPRIGIRVGLERAWRYWLAGHPSVSGPAGARGVASAVPRARRGRTALTLSRRDP